MYYFNLGRLIHTIACCYVGIRESKLPALSGSLRFSIYFARIYGHSVVPWQRRERACQDRCRDPAALALTINRGDGVVSEWLRTPRFLLLKQMPRAEEITWMLPRYFLKPTACGDVTGGKDDTVRARTTLTLLMEFPVAARWRNRKGGPIINN